MVSSSVIAKYRDSEDNNIQDNIKKVNYARFYKFMRNGKLQKLVPCSRDLVKCEGRPIQLQCPYDHQPRGGAKRNEHTWTHKLHTISLRDHYYMERRTWYANVKCRMRMLMPNANDKWIMQILIIKVTWHEVIVMWHWTDAEWTVSSGFCLKMELCTGCLKKGGAKNIAWHSTSQFTYYEV